MSAALVCGKRRSSYFEEISSSTSPPHYCSSLPKRLRYAYPTSPEEVNPGDSTAAAAASAEQHALPQDDPRSKWVELFMREMTSASTMDDAKARASWLLEVFDKSVRSGASTDEQGDRRSEWVGVFLGEMTTAASTDDAKARACRLLEAWEKSVSHSHASTTEAAADGSPSQKVYVMLKQQLDTLIEENKNLIHDNTILKKGVSIQHDRQKKHEQQLKNLELENYELKIHLRQALQVTQNNSSIRYVS